MPGLTLIQPVGVSGRHAYQNTEQEANENQ